MIFDKSPFPLFPALPLPVQWKKCFEQGMECFPSLLGVLVQKTQPLGVISLCN